MKYLLTTLTTIMAFGMLTVSMPIFSQTPDGQPPAQEDVCATESGAAFGLCTAYCEAMDCDSDNPSASFNACDKIEAKFLQATGRELPCRETGSICGIPKPLVEGLCVCGFPEIGCYEQTFTCETSQDCPADCSGQAMCVLPGNDFPEECGENNSEGCFYIDP